MIMKKQSPNCPDHDHTITRRKFIGTTALSSAALLGGGLTSLLSRSASAANDFDFLEKSIPELQAAMASGQLTSKDLVKGYLRRIASLNPLLHSVIETNPNAISIAQHLDNERRRGHVRGPLHGIPILLKDNIATDDNMETTAGSLALVHSRVPADAVIIQRLREAGAVILGKANLGEWANFRGTDIAYPLAVGWSARGGNTINAYDLGYTSWGSSSGSANGVAANLCSVAVGTETDGSITGPSAVENIVGLKPTLGLVSQDGIIPIAHQQDSAGPMGRSVTDVAILLGALQSPFGDVLGHQLPSGYTQFLQRGALIADNLDAIVAPHLTNSTGPAVAGYPNLSLPVGIRRGSGRPAGMLMYSTFLREPKLIGFAYDLEQRMKVRREPQFLGSVTPVPNGHFCDQHAEQGQMFPGTANMPPHGRIF